jgi:two-component system phosphate regulon sensor histidine kinase PhoR
MEIENLRSVLDAVESAVLVTDASGAVIRANIAGARFFQNRTRLIGARIEELFTQAEVLGLHAAATAGRNASSQIRIPRPEGVRICQVMAYRVAWNALPPREVAADGIDTGTAGPETGQSRAGASSSAVVMVVRDVTELAMAVQLKTDFVANASHELRTPLSSIRGAVETIRDGAKDEPAMLDRLTQMIAQNVTRLEELVRDMLDLSRLETPDAPVSIEAVDVAALAEQLAEQFAQVCEERDIRIEHDVAADAEVVRTDPRLLQLVLKNLVDNATKFAYPGTAIRIVAERSTGMGRAGVRFKVVDKGMGIPIGHQQRIFERFYQVDPSRSGVAARRGTGLGLAIVKHAVKNLGGTIRVESVWKQGTTMIVELPSAMDEDDNRAGTGDDGPLG